MRLGWSDKGWWLPGEPVELDELLAAKHTLFDGPFSWPVMVLRRSALDQNLSTLAGFCARHGFDFAPHGKTTMAPKLFQEQLDAGAWGITVATPHQLLAARRSGVPRAVLANELLDPPVITWLDGEIRQGFECFTFVDSVASAQAVSGTSIPVLLELGYLGGRGGCRDVASAVEVATEAGGQLAGLTAWEGNLGTIPEVEAYLGFLREVAHELSARGLLGEEVVVSAGGSAYFDVVAAQLGGAWLPGHRLRVILRSGAYISHDHVHYKAQTPFLRVPAEGSLSPALQLWARVLSMPEAGLALAGFGKRDAPIDLGLPVPLLVRRPDGRLDPADGATVTKLNDQHAFVSVPSELGVRIGDLMAFGISHPCTAFDKWRVLPVVDDAYLLVDAVPTLF